MEALPGPAINASPNRLQKLSGCSWSFTNLSMTWMGEKNIRCRIELRLAIELEWREIGTKKCPCLLSPRGGRYGAQWLRSMIAHRKENILQVASLISNRRKWNRQRRKLIKFIKKFKSLLNIDGDSDGRAVVWRRRIQSKKIRFCFAGLPRECESQIYMLSLHWTFYGGAPMRYASRFFQLLKWFFQP